MAPSTSVASFVVLFYLEIVCAVAAYQSSEYQIAMKGQCSKGEYLFNGVECRRCPAETFTERNNSYPKCYRCKPCGKFSHVKKNCTTTHNTKCACNEGRYFDSGLDFCALCDECGVGEGVTGRCKGRSNTQCAPCIEGETFSNSTSVTEKCQPCRTCKKGEIVGRACTKRNNTVCKPRPGNGSEMPNSSVGGTVDTNTGRPRSTTEWPTETTGTQGPKDDTAKNSGITNTYLDLNLILAGVAGVVLVILIVLVVMLLRKKFRRSANSSRKRNTASSTPHSGSSISVSVTEDPDAPHSNKIKCSPYAPEKYLRDVSYSLVSELSRHLNPEGRWKTLAGRLEFTTTDILNMNIKPEEATEAMLNRWGQRHDSTVNHLFEVLMSLGWKHEANLIRKYIYLP